MDIAFCGGLSFDHVWRLVQVCPSSVCSIWCWVAPQLCAASGAGRPSTSSSIWWWAAPQLCVAIGEHGVHCRDALVQGPPGITFIAYANFTSVTTGYGVATAVPLLPCASLSDATVLGSAYWSPPACCVYCLSLLEVCCVSCMREYRHYNAHLRWCQ